LIFLNAFAENVGMTARVLRPKPARTADPRPAVRLRRTQTDDRRYLPALRWTLIVSAWMPQREKLNATTQTFVWVVICNPQASSR
jgi:hypothetical protein